MVADFGILDSQFKHPGSYVSVSRYLRLPGRGATNLAGEFHKS